MVQTIRVACGGVYTGRYTLQDQYKTAIDLTAATPSGVVLKVFNVDDGVMIASTPCTIITPNLGLIEYTIRDALAATRVMANMQFEVTTPTNILIAPGGQEQGLWVY